MSEYIGNVCLINLKTRQLIKFKVIYENSDYLVCLNGYGGQPFTLRKRSTMFSYGHKNVWTNYEDFITYKEKYGWNYDEVYIYVPKKHKVLFNKLIAETSNMGIKQYRMEILVRKIKDSEARIQTLKDNQQREWERSNTNIKIEQEQLRKYQDEYEKLLKEETTENE